MSRLGLPAGLATSIGSLPHCDPSEAVDFVLRQTPRLPAAPSLPAHSKRERMIAQAALGVSGITVESDGSLMVDHGSIDVDHPLADPSFSGDGFVGLRAFLNAVSDRVDPIKVQITGPVTFGIALHAAGLPPVQAFALASAVTRARAQALLELLDERVPQCTRVVFLDDPGLTACTQRDFPLTPSAASDLLSASLAALEGRAITGVHCCGEADWKVVLQAGPQILSCPVEGGIDEVPGALAAFLERGGWVAWGAVPTHEPVGETTDRLWRRLSALWCALVQDGCDPVRLRTQAMITPACGLARHGVPQAEQVMAFTNALAERLHDQAIGVRLSVGA
jgi:methionine synthase II (cobalamin-independent)